MVTRAVLSVSPLLWGAFAVLASACFAFSGNEQTAEEPSTSPGGKQASAGQGGSSASGGSAGTSAQGSSGGKSAGSGGTGGASPGGGQGGASGAEAQGGIAGSQGGAGAGGGAGTAGESGSSGQAGATGGASGAGGFAGEGGQGGAGGSAGGAAGMSGSSGQSGGSGQGGAGGSAPLVIVSPEADKCPGLPVTLSPGETTTTLDFAGSADNSNSKGCSSGFLLNKDLVVALSATESGTVTAAISGSLATGGILYVRAECDVKASELTCKQDILQQNVQVNFPIQAGEILYLFAEGNGNNKVPLKLTLTPDNAATCGNGVIEPNEPCDDKNSVAGDGCNACQVTAACTKKEQSPQTSGINGCSTMNFFPASISSVSENDWYCVSAAAGKTIFAQTYTGIPGHCTQEPNNTLAEIYKGDPVAVSNYNCSGSQALACNDDYLGQLVCSRVEYKVPLGQGGQYCVRVARSDQPGGNQQIPEYGVVVSVY